MPSLQARWAEELLGRPLPVETVACDRCELCAPPAEQAPGAGPSRFNPLTKCCTYSPRLPAYLVGEILADPDPLGQPGRLVVEERLATGAGVSPLGVGPTRAELARYQRSAPERFGTGEELLCPYFLAERCVCAIWPYRSPACITWFCKHARGAVSLRFWQALRRFLEAVQSSMVRHCLLELKLGAAAVERLFPPAVDGESSPVSSPDLVEPAAWGRYADRPAEYFRACAATVRDLPWSAVSEIGGAEVQLFARLVVDRFADLCSAQIPTRLRAGPYTTAALDDGRVRLVSYRSLDPLDVPRALLDALARFDGRPTQQVLRECAEHGLEIDGAMLRRLLDFGILTCRE